MRHRRGCSPRGGMSAWKHVCLGLGIGAALGALLGRRPWHGPKQAPAAVQSRVVTVVRRPRTTGNHTVDIGYLINGPSIFLEAALSLDQIVDKVTAHEYEVMYGEHLMPYYYKHPEMKMLEIGLGCTMTYGAGGSVKLWKKLFPRMDLWEAEYDTACVEQTDIPPWLHVLVGDQSDPETLDRWIKESGGNFDVVVDDGGHTNCQIMTSFEKLWPHVKPGGLYFIEDLQMTQLESKQQSTKTCNGKNLVSHKLKGIMETLVYQPMIRNDRKVERNDVETLFCQNEACVLRKRKTTTIAVNTERPSR